MKTTAYSLCQCCGLGNQTQRSIGAVRQNAFAVGLNHLGTNDSNNSRVLLGCPTNPVLIADFPVHGLLRRRQFAVGTDPVGGNGGGLLQTGLINEVTTIHVFDRAGQPLTSGRILPFALLTNGFPDRFPVGLDPAVYRVDLEHGLSTQRSTSRRSCACGEISGHVIRREILRTLLLGGGYAAAGLVPAIPERGITAGEANHAQVQGLERVVRLLGGGAAAVEPSVSEHHPDVGVLVTQTRALSGLAQCVEAALILTHGHVHLRLCVGGTKGCKRQ